MATLAAPGADVTVVEAVALAEEAAGLSSRSRLLTEMKLAGLTKPSEPKVLDVSPEVKEETRVKLGLPEGLEFEVRQLDFVKAWPVC